MITRLIIGLINFFTGVAVFFLGLRVVLRLFAANPDVHFVQWVYNSSGVLLEPFRGIFETKVITPDHLLDFSALFAMMVYALVGMLLLALVAHLTPSRVATTRE